jgi:hypothetical protein
MHSEAMVAQAEAQLNAADVAVADAQPAFDRSERLFHRSVISARMPDRRSSFNARKMSELVAQRGLGRAPPCHRQAEQRRHDRACALRRRRHRKQRARRNGLARRRGGFTRTGICTIVVNSLEMEVDVSEAFISRVHPDCRDDPSQRLSR